MLYKFLAAAPAIRDGLGRPALPIVRATHEGLSRFFDRHASSEIRFDGQDWKYTVRPSDGVDIDGDYEAGRLAAMFAVTPALPGVGVLGFLAGWGFPQSGPALQLVSLGVAVAVVLYTAGVCSVMDDICVEVNEDAV